jgi:hypothetical protein
MATTAPSRNPTREALEAALASGRRPTPREMLWRVSGALNQLLTTGVVRRADDGVLELLVNAEEAAQGGMVTISLYVPVRCSACEGREPERCAHCEGRGTTDALFSAWLTVYAGAADGELLAPSVALPGMVRPVVFRLRTPRLP